MGYAPITFEDVEAFRPGEELSAAEIKSKLILAAKVAMSQYGAMRDRGVSGLLDCVGLFEEMGKGMMGARLAGPPTGIREGGAKNTDGDEMRFADPVCTCSKWFNLRYNKLISYPLSFYLATA